MRWRKRQKKTQYNNYNDSNKEEKKGKVKLYSYEATINIRAQYNK